MILSLAVAHYAIMAASLAIISVALRVARGFSYIFPHKSSTAEEKVPFSLVMNSTLGHSKLASPSGTPVLSLAWINALEISKIVKLVYLE